MEKAMAGPCRPCMAVPRVNGDLFKQRLVIQTPTTSAMDFGMCGTVCGVSIHKCTPEFWPFKFYITEGTHHEA